MCLPKLFHLGELSACRKLSFKDYSPYVGQCLETSSAGLSTASSQLKDAVQTTRVLLDYVTDDQQPRLVCP
jgi:hypothetical protein